MKNFVNQDDLEVRVKILMSKLQQTKREKDQALKENQQLQQEIIQMQSHLRCMVSGFANTSNNFPLINELCNSISEFYKCECFDIFFDILQDLNMKGVIFYFQQSMLKVDRLIQEHFQPSFKQLQQVGCLDTLDGPVMNVLRKSFQGTYKQIVSKFQDQKISTELQKTLNLEQGVDTYIFKLIEIMLCTYISDPPLLFEINTIGQKIPFNQVKHDPIDGFLKPKEECIILMPVVLKGQEMMVKALVLSSNYQLE
ncbi:hypothetical protein pb186bvf_018294 [Paramecium bursaria]